ncbi:DUF4434 domain-containing protein [Leifsonia sp. LS-T14]|uniref:DUF4434 domain-containing protein n=1 Tax=unclassified Leifsonia TaxID=2663824 RepID=UPI0035A592D1
MPRWIRMVAAISAAVALSLLAPNGAVAAERCASRASTYSGTFWSPYDDWSVGDMESTFREQSSVGIRSTIVVWSVHLDANDAAYPSSPSLGYSRFNDSIPKLVQAARATGQKLWMGLVVAPDGFPAHHEDTAWLTGFVNRSKAVAHDLYALYGNTIAGWYVPTEPGFADIDTAGEAKTYAGWLGQLTAYLHSHDGNKPVMVSPFMPSAIYTGASATRYVQLLKPLIDTAKVDVWNLQDGFGMTAWSPSQEAAAFTLAKSYTRAAGSALWASVYTPARDGNGTPVSVARMAPYLDAIAATGATLSQWTYNDYFSGTRATTDRALRVANLAAYRAWCS